MTFSKREKLQIALATIMKQVGKRSSYFSIIQNKFSPTWAGPLKNPGATPTRYASMTRLCAAALRKLRFGSFSGCLPTENYRGMYTESEKKIREMWGMFTEIGIGQEGFTLSERHLCGWPSLWTGAGFLSEALTFHTPRINLLPLKLGHHDVRHHGIPDCYQANIK